MSAQNFDTWLEAELCESFGALMTSVKAAQGFRPRNRTRRRILLAPGLAIGAAVKAGIAFAAAAAVTAGTATAITGSPDPAVWEQRVEVQVEHCTQILGSRQRGIGDCISDLVSKPDRPRGVRQKPTESQPPTSTDQSKPASQPSSAQDQPQPSGSPGQTGEGDKGSSKHAKDPASKQSDSPHTDQD